MSRSARELCTEISPECPVEFTTYGYYPNLTVNAFFIALFGSLCLLQIGIGTLRRTWTYMLALVIATFGEAVGYGGRLMMHNNPWSGEGFKPQICCLVLAPTLLAAGIYLTLKHLVVYCGPEHSRLKPPRPSAEVLRPAAGDRDSNPKLAHAGNALIVTGIVFQVATMAVCGLLMIDYFRRFHKARKASSSSTGEYGSEWEKNRTDPQIRRNSRIFCSAIAASFVAIFIRCIYRVPEMAGGWGNPLMRKENEFLVLDGTMIGIASTAMTVFHPGYFFPPMRKFKK